MGTQSITTDSGHIRDLLSDIEALFAEKIIDNEEKEYFNGFVKLKGATDEEINKFESDFNVTLPEDFKEYYKIKNGSEHPFKLLYTTYEDNCIPFTILSLKDIENIKKHFCKHDELLEKYYDKSKIKKLNKRIKPYLYNKKWFPFAQIVGGDLYLMLDFDPSETGKSGQIIFYAHDPDFIYYIAESFTELLEDTKNNLEDGWYEECSENV